MTDEKKKAAFFADWEGVPLKDSTGFQSGWHKGFEAGRKYENERLMEIADALLELKRCQENAEKAGSWEGITNADEWLKEIR